jgi:hypothetical protein
LGLTATGDVIQGSCPSGLGLKAMLMSLLFVKIVTKSKEEKPRHNLAGTSMERNGSQRAVLLVIILTCKEREYVKIGDRKDKTIVKETNK